MALMVLEVLEDHQAVLMLETVAQVDLVAKVAKAGLVVMEAYLVVLDQVVLQEIRVVQVTLDHQDQMVIVKEIIEIVRILICSIGVMDLVDLADLLVVLDQVDLLEDLLVIIYIILLQSHLITMVL